jgi:hypothetical protein
MNCQQLGEKVLENLRRRPQWNGNKVTKTREKPRKTGSCDLNNRSAVGEVFLLPNAENPLL